MRAIKYMLVFFWVMLLTLPVLIIVYKLVDYLMINPFREWHITILWVFITPISLIIIFMIKDKEKEK